MADLKTIDLTDDFVELVRRAATVLPTDMAKALTKARANEKPGSAAEGGRHSVGGFLRQLPGCFLLILCLMKSKGLTLLNATHLHACTDMLLENIRK